MRFLRLPASFPWDPIYGLDLKCPTEVSCVWKVIRVWRDYTYQWIYPLVSSVGKCAVRRRSLVGDSPLGACLGRVCSCLHSFFPLRFLVALGWAAVLCSGPSTYLGASRTTVRQNKLSSFKLCVKFFVPAMGKVTKIDCGTKVGSLLCLYLTMWFTSLWNWFAGGI